MNKLRDEIINRCVREDKWIVADVATVAQEIALKWLEKAFTDAYLKAEEGDCIGAGTDYKLWLRENNLYYEPQTKEEI